MFVTHHFLAVFLSARCWNLSFRPYSGAPYLYLDHINAVVNRLLKGVHVSREHHRLMKTGTLLHCQAVNMTDRSSTRRVCLHRKCMHQWILRPALDEIQKLCKDRCAWLVFHGFRPGRQGSSSYVRRKVTQCSLRRFR